MNAPVIPYRYYDYFVSSTIYQKILIGGRAHDLYTRNTFETAYFICCIGQVVHTQKRS